MWRFLGVAMLLVGCTASNDVQLFAVDFGVVPSGELHEAPLRVRNDSRSTAKLVRVEQRDGARGFTIVPRFQPLEAGAEATWSVQFDALKEGAATARFVAVFEHGESEVLLTARSAARCELAATLDFDDTDTRTLELSNPTSTAARVAVGEVAAPFTSDVQGSVLLAPGETKTVSLRLDVSVEDGRFEQPWSIQTRPDCAVTSVQLRAERRVAPLRATPGRLFFADTVGQLQLTISNTSGRPMQLTALTVVGAGYGLGDSGPRLVPANGEVNLIVRRTDFTTSGLSGELVLRSDSTTQPEIRVPLLAKRSAACVTASTQAVTFAAVEEGCHATSTRLSLKNECPHAVGFTTPSVAAPFAIVAAAPRGVIAAGASLPIDVTFAPTQAGQFGAPLRLDIDVLDGTQQLQVPLFGDARPMTVRDEEFRSASFDRKRDVLFVIDDSVRMAPHADHLAQNLADFAHILSLNTQPSRVAVMSTSTTPGVRGHLRRAPSGAGWIDAATPTELQTFAGWRGQQTGRSSCLEALDAAFNSPLRNDPAELGGFLRPDAALQIICITNGPDELEAPAAQLISSLVASLPQPVSIAMVVRSDSSQTCGGTLETGALRAFAFETNGRVTDLCYDWGRAVALTGPNVFGVRSQFFLSSRPDQTRAPLRVWLQGIETNNLWVYEAVSNSVRLDPSVLTGTERLVRVQYTPQCAP